MRSLTTSLDERLKENAKLYSVKLFKRVLKIYVRGGDEGREWRRREGRDWEGRKVKGGKGKREGERERGGGEGLRGKEREGREREERERERETGEIAKNREPQNKHCLICYAGFA